VAWNDRKSRKAAERKCGPDEHKNTSPAEEVAELENLDDASLARRLAILVPRTRLVRFSRSSKKDLGGERAGENRGLGLK
jgi:hypothetical protein